MTRLTLLLGTVLLGHLIAEPAAAERRVAWLDFSIVRDYASLGTYEAPLPPMFGSGGVGPSTHTVPCVEGVFGGSSVRWEIKRMPDTSPVVIPVYQVDNPPVTQDRYVFKGDVGYDDVGEPAYFEMWSEFPDGSRFFSRTLADNGPTMRLRGTSAVRPFELPFTARSGQRPKHLTVSLVMASPGAVTLSNAMIAEADPPATHAADVSPDASSASGEAATRPAGSLAAPGPVRLADLPPAVAVAVRQQMERDLVAAIADARGHSDAAEQFARRPDAQSSVKYELKDVEIAERRIAQLRRALAQPMPATQSADEIAAWPGGLGGRTLMWLSEHFVACFLTLIGLSLVAALLMRRLAGRGRGRAFVTGVFGLILAGGVLEIFAAGIALGLGLPAVTWATLLGCAAIMVVVPAITLPQVRRQYADAELRRMRAMDVPA